MTTLVTKIGIILALAGFWTAFARPSNSARATAEGVAAYEAGNAAEARRLFENAMAWEGAEPILEMNAATAALEARQFDRGLQLNAAVAKESAALADDATYNSGTAFLRQQRPEEAIELLRESLRKDPSHLDAKRNLELAERLREQRNQSGGDSGQQEDQGQDESGQSGATPGGDQQDPRQSSERGEVNPEDILRAVAQQEAEELKRMRAARTEGQRRGSGW